MKVARYLKLSYSGTILFDSFTIVQMVDMKQIRRRGWNIQTRSFTLLVQMQQQCLAGEQDEPLISRTCQISS